MSALMSKIVLVILFLSHLACGTKEKIDRKGSGDYQTNNASKSSDAIVLDTDEVSEDTFQVKEKEGEGIFTPDVMDRVMGQQLEANDPVQSSSNQVLDVEKNSDNQAKEVIDDKSNSQEGDDTGSQPVDVKEEANGEETAEESYSDEKYQESMALAQSEMQTKLDEMIPNAPSFVMSKLKGNADQLLHCSGDEDCEDKAKGLMVTSYSVSRFLDARDLNLAATDINAAIAAGTKLLSDIALIIVEATSPEPDPMTIIMLVDIFISDLRDLIMSFLQ